MMKRFRKKQDKWLDLKERLMSCAKHLGETVSRDGLAKLGDIMEEVVKSQDSNQESSDDIIRFHKYLDDLRQDVERGVGACGGHFEWVDSVLVKTLERGHWLLLDNVNFCSPSVLDRLNALLEPGGVLTIHEQGISGDQVRCVVPHPDFRLILAMDPKNGEISGAMRNRGVEIYLLGEEDEDSFLSRRDVYQLLAGLGLRNIELQELLLHIHSALQTALPVWEKPGLLELHRGTFFTVKQLSFGLDAVTAVRHSVVDTYIQSQKSNVKKMELNSILNGILSEVVASELTAASTLTLAPSVSDFVQNPASATALTQASILYALEENNAIYVPNILDIDKYIRAAIQIFLTMSSPSDLQIRWSILSPFLSKQMSDIFCSTAASENLRKILQDRIDGSSVISYLRNKRKVLTHGQDMLTDGTHLPFDLRWHSQLAPLLTCGNSVVREQQILLNSLSNKLHLVIAFRLQQTYESAAENVLKLQPKSLLKQLPWQLSWAVEKGQESSRDLSHPAIALLFPLLKAIDALIENVLALEQLQLDDEQTYTMFDALEWRHRFWLLVTQPVRFVQPETSLFLSSLALHWMWLKEKALPVFLQNVGQKHKLRHHMAALGSSMDAHISIGVEARHMKAETWRKHIGNVQPFKSWGQAHRHQELERLSACTSVWSNDLASDDGFTENCKVTRWFDDGEERRLMLANTLTDNAAGNEVDASLRDLQECISSKYVVGKQDGGDHTFTDFILTQAKHVALRVQLWPMLDHLNLCLELRVIVELLSEGPSTVISSNVNRAWEEQSLQCSPSPPSHLALFMKMKRNLEKKTGVETHCRGNAEILFNFYHRLQNCPATYDSIHWLYWTPHNDKSDKMMTKKDSVANSTAVVLSPLQSQFAAHLMVDSRCSSIKINSNANDSGISCNVPLNFCQEKGKQMELVNWIWWRNSAALGSEHYSFKKNKSMLLVGLFRTALLGILQSDPKSMPLKEKVYEDQQDTANAMNEMQHFVAAILSVSDLLDDDAKILMLRCFETLKKLMDILFCVEESENNAWIFGEAWLRLGMFSIHILSIFAPFDPAERRATLAKYCEQEISELDSELSVHKWMQAAMTGEAMETMSPKMRHPHLNDKLNKLEVLNTDHKNLKNDQAYRPQPSQFNTLMMDLQQFTGSIVSQSIIEHLAKDIEAARTNSSLFTPFINRVEAWKKSVNAFMVSIKKRYPLYTDLWMPLFAGIAQVSIGIDLLTASVKKQEALRKCGLKATDLRHLVINLAPFPSSKTGVQLAQTLLAPHTIDIVQRLLEPINSSTSGTTEYIDKLLLSGLEEIKNNIVTDREINASTWAILLPALRLFLLRWQHQEEEQRRRKTEKEAAYEFRAKTYCDEPSPDQDDANYVRQMFPMYEQEFETIDERAVSSLSTAEEMDLDNYQEDVLSNHTMEVVCFVHCQLMSLYTFAPWLTVDASNIHTNYYRPFVARFQVAGHILKEYVHLLDADVDHKLIGGHAVYSALLQQAISNNTQDLAKSDVSYNIYHDSNIGEVVQCRPVLEKFSSRIMALLLDWPEHPTLKQVQDVIDRVLSFPVTDPLMKFVTGLEMVLAKAQDWEVNAHKGVSLMDEMEGVSQLIIKWRKLELGCWSSCLDSVTNKLEMANSKWWFHVFAIVETYLKEEASDSYENMTEEALTTTIQQFLESSSIAEFKPRLKIIYAFHCHLVHVKSSKKQQNLLKILWHAYMYYSQFHPAIIEKIVQLRKPIEKEVKGFVKIVRWNDVNFWTIKETVDKSHRTIAKFMKGYEKVLNQPVRPLLTDSSPPSAKPTETAIQMQPDVYVIPSKFKRFIENSPLPMVPSSILANLPKLFQRLRKLSRRVVENVSSRHLMQLVEDLTADIITTMHDLQRLEVNKSLPKPKQISEAKSIHIRKRKALSDLFKTMHTLGVSYRKGYLMWNAKNWTQFMNLPQMDIEAAVKQLKQLSADDILIRSWQGSLHYFYRSVSRIALLSTSSQTPHKDLGLPNLHRICGIPSHLMSLAQIHHQTLSQVEQDFVKLRLVVSDIDVAVNESANDEWPLPQATIWEHIHLARSLHSRSQQLFEQFSILLNCCPRSLDGWVNSSVLPNESAPGIAMSKGDKNWKDAFELVRRAKAVNSRCRLLLNNLCPHLPRLVYVYSQKTVSDLENVFEELTFVSELAFQLSALFTSTDSRSGFVHSLCLFRDDTSSASEHFHQWVSSFVANNNHEVTSDLKAVKLCQTLITKVVRNILLVIQDLYKSQQSLAPSVDEEELLSNSLPKLCHKFTTMSAQLKLKRILRLVTKAILQLQYVLSKSAHTYQKYECCRWFKSIYPLLGQYLALVQFCLTEGATLHRTLCKLMCILLGIFNELVQKGFCVPDEYSEDVSGEGATDFQDIEGGGLGEGEGLKDVSDRIENEDQLEGAQQEGAQKEEEDLSQSPELKEEEHGIEMSDDFDGKSHDLDVDDGSDSNSDESEDDEEQLDKQMGEVDEGMDKLDEKIWGSDSDDDDADEDGDEKMEDGAGDEQSSEPQMVAKDDNKSKEDGKGQSHSDSEEDLDGKEPPINELDEREFNENEIDPYYGNKVPEEVEPMEVSDDLNLDSGGEEKDCDELEKVDKAEGDEEIKDDDEAPVMEEDINEDNENGEKPPETEEDSKEDGKDAKVAEENEAEQAENEDKVEENASSAKPDSSQEAVQTTDSNAISEAPSKESETQIQSESDPQDGQQSGQDTDCGMAQADDTEQGQRGKASLQASLPDSSTEQKQTMQQQLRGQANLKRSLGNPEEKVHKRVRTMDDPEENQLETKTEMLEKRHADLYQHVAQPNKEDLQARDAATVEQAKMQEVAENESKAPEDDDASPQEDVAMNDDKPEDEVNVKEIKSSQITATSLNASDSNQKEKKITSLHESALPNGENILTLTAGQSQESTFHTNLRAAMEVEEVQDVEEIRAQLERHLGQWSEWRNKSEADGLAALTVWHQFELVTLPLAQELCEQLRLVLEPSLAAKLRGDYRTGKRINMRKVIQYIASQFRKDKIWMRRTKPSKRQYQVMLAVDDSSSMADNQVKELAFESLAVVSKALVLLEVGELAVASFGESFKLLHPFHEPFTDIAGAQILNQFTFLQKQTRVGQLLREAVNIMKGSEKKLRGNVDAAQLLLILSDGRGLFVEGQETVQQAVRRAHDNHIFVVFIILDLPTNKHSIFDIRLPVYDKSGTGMMANYTLRLFCGLNKERVRSLFDILQVLSFVKSYMDEFPFPFYVVLRDIMSLPAVLSDALRQWFELVSAAT